MMKLFRKSSRKNEKGQVLVFMALVFTGLVAIIGLAIDTGYMYVSYSRLSRGVDAAALAGTGEFKIPTGYDAPCSAACVALRDNNIVAATKQMLDLNGIVPDPTAGFSDTLSGTVGMSIQTCDNTPGDAVLCAAPLQKIIRVKVQERIPLFFLKVIPGIPSTVPISIESLATAASADVMLAIDTSDSMTYDVPMGNVMRDPHACNPSSCQPMEDVKAAARAFADKLYYPYDRLGLVTFNQYATVNLALSEDLNVIRTKISAITVFAGVSTLLSDGTTSGTKCIYFRDYKNINPATTNNVDQSTPWVYNPNANYWDYNDNDVLAPHNTAPPQRLVQYPPSSGSPSPITYTQDPYGPCRLFDNDSSGGGFLGMDCPMFYGLDPDPSHCGSTNIAGGINLGSRALTGVYPASYPPPLPDNRHDSVWVLVLLTDGAANAAYDGNGYALCPHSTWRYDAPCRDLNANSRHGSASTLYDAQDQARDMFDIAHQDNIYIYNIGLGNLVTSIPPDNTGPAPGETLLKYPETTLGNGKYYFAPSGTDLTPIFLAIAALITSRISQ